MVLASPRKFGSKSELNEHLEIAGSRSIVIGEDAEAPNAFFSFLVEAPSGNLEIGVISSGLGSNPIVALLDQGRVAIIGHDTWLTWIDTDKPSVKATRRLGGVFFEFLGVDGNGKPVVLHELGAIRIDSSSVVIWSIDTDIIEDWKVDDKGNLILTIMDQDFKTIVSLDSGKTKAGKP